MLSFDLLIHILISLVKKTMIYLLVCYGFMLVSGNYIKSAPKAIAQFKDGKQK